MSGFDLMDISLISSVGFKMAMMLLHTDSLLLGKIHAKEKLISVL